MQTQPQTPIVRDSNPTQTFYDRISRSYDFIAYNSEHEATERGLEELRVTAGEWVLEIGHGTGHAIVELARSVGPRGLVCGLDLSSGMHTVAQKRVDDEGVGEAVHLEVGDARTLPYEDGSFDAVFMSFTLELFAEADLLAVLAEVRRVLRPGGRLGVVSLALRTQPGALGGLYGWLHRCFPNAFGCRPIDAARCLRRSGFDLHKTVEMSIWTLPVVAVMGVKPRHGRAQTGGKNHGLERSQGEYPRPLGRHS